jgi:methylenetetrahydrofolate--tRNA-(uracil-5-)-methyltransferase
LLIQLAEKTRIPAGGALAVDRELFARRVTEAIKAHPNIILVREELKRIPDLPTVVASGPLTSRGLSEAIQELTGERHLYFYDAIAPIVLADTIDMEIAYRASRYERGDQQTGDYINCPMTREEYSQFVNALTSAERIELRTFESDIESGVSAGADRFFEGCIPVEILARRGYEAIAYGPMRPVGLINPRTGKHPYAAVQLRQDDMAATLYNLVGFQTNLKFVEQERVFRMIPGLRRAGFVRYGQMHRNTFINSPALLRPTLQFVNREDLFFAGQITGVEGYAGNIATGLLAGWNAARLVEGKIPVSLPRETMLGALCHYVTHASSQDFQPMKANFGILPELLEGEGRLHGKRRRAQVYVHRAHKSMEAFLLEESS